MSTSIQARNTYFLLIGEKRITFYISESVFEIECRRNIFFMQMKRKIPVLNWSWPSSKHLGTFLLKLSWYSARNYTLPKASRAQVLAALTNLHILHFLHILHIPKGRQQCVTGMCRLWLDLGPLKRQSEFVNSKTHNAVRVFEQEITQFVCGEIIICFAWSVFAKRRGVCILHMININA